MKYLIVGLGNIGAEYINTRHNIGFTILDALADASNVVFATSRLAYTAQIKFKGRTLVLIKPTTYVNLSGKSVNYWMQKEKIAIDKVLIVVDDLAIPYGKLRLKEKGGDAGHNGLKDINATLGSQHYARLRFGIGDDFNTGHQVNYVLGNWDKKELDALPKRIDKAIEFIKGFATIGVKRTMNQYNNS